MTRERLFDIWAPRDSIWTPWAKAVLFANHRDGAISQPLDPLAVQLNFEIEDFTAMVVDLPGASGVSAAMELAQRGFRPVPLYNAVPGPGSAGFDASMEVVDVRSILNALVQGAEELSTLSISPNAPPAFLLDANRRFRKGVVREAQFDNRSICFPTDFPSASFLAAHEVQRVLCVQETPASPQEDLVPALARWQAAGFFISRVSAEAGAIPELISVQAKLSIWRYICGALTRMRLKRNLMGGFGGNWLPAHYSGAG